MDSLIETVYLRSMDEKLDAVQARLQKSRAEAAKMAADRVKTAGRPGCSCAKCSLPSTAERDPLTPENIRYELKTNPFRLAELEAHGVQVTSKNKNKDNLVAELEVLAARSAKFLTRSYG